MRASLGVLTFLAASPLAAQDLPKGRFPEGWMARTDRTDESAAEIVFVDMAPGWHVTTGPSSILYNPATAAAGRYRVESETFLFDPGRRNEGYGFFFGGRDLEGPGQAYTYFLVRRSGEFLVKRRAGPETAEVIGWTAHPAIVKYDERGEGVTAKNVLAVELEAEDVRFFVNGEEVARLTRSDVDTDGIIGLRVNHGLNVHVTSLAVETR